ncbi:hypothetical protein QFZ89_005749 [Paraburkholderia youngii]
MPLAPVHQRDHQQLRAIAHAFDLQLHELVAALAERVGGSEPFALDDVAQAHAQRRIGDAHDAPRLHVADARRVMGRVEQTPQHRRIDRIGHEVAHVAAFVNRAIDRLALGVVKRLRHERGRP